MDQSSPFEDQLAAILPRLRRFAHALSRDAADADDLTQATIERALRSKTQWEPGTKLDSWCYRIMRNLWIDTARARSRKTAREAPEEEGLNVGEDPRPGIEAAVDLHRVMAAMTQLPDEQREVVALILSRASVIARFRKCSACRSARCRAGSCAGGPRFWPWWVKHERR